MPGTITHTVAPHIHSGHFVQSFDVLLMLARATATIGFDRWTHINDRPLPALEKLIEWDEDFEQNVF